MKKKFALNTATALLLQIITIICNFVLPRLYLQYYNSDTNGLIQSLSQFLSFISLCELGVGQVIQTSLYKPLAERNNKMVSNVVSSGKRFFRQIAYVLSGYIVILILFFPSLASVQFNRPYIAMLILAMSLNYFAQYYFGIVDSLLLNADQRNYINSIAQIGTTILNTILCIILIVRGSSIQFVKLVSSFVLVMKPVLVHTYVRKNYQIDAKAKYTGEPIAQKWNGIAQHIASYILSSTDIIVLTLFSTLGNVSVYSIYNMIANGINLLYHSILGGLRSMLGRLWVEQNKVVMLEAFEKVEIALHSISSFLYICTGILIVPFVRVYTNGISDYEYIKPVFSFLLVFSYALQGIRAPYSILVHVAGHYKETQKCYILSAAINLGVSLLLVSTWNLVGIAIGTALSMLFQVIWLAVYNAKNTLNISLFPFCKLCLTDIISVIIALTAIDVVIPGNMLVPGNYVEWLMLAILTAIIVAIVVIVVFYTFYRKNFARMLQRSTCNH